MKAWFYIYWKSTLAIAVVAAWLILIVLSTITTVVGQHSGVIVGIYPQSKSQGKYEHVMIKLETGDVIEASIPSETGFQYLPGTTVNVTTYEGALFHQKSYKAEVNRGKLGSNTSLKADGADAPPP